MLRAIIYVYKVTFIVTSILMLFGGVLVAYSWSSFYLEQTNHAFVIGMMVGAFLGVIFLIGHYAVAIENNELLRRLVTMAERNHVDVELPRSKVIEVRAEPSLRRPGSVA